MRYIYAYAMLILIFINISCSKNDVEGKDISVNLTVYEVDKLTQTVKIIIEGKNLDFDEIQEILNSMNCIIHSVDQVAAGKKIVEDIDTPQD